MLSRELLTALAAAAAIHAAEQHAVHSPLTLAVVDRILDHHRQSTEATDWEPLIQCYGAWFGEWVSQEVDGEWCGMDEAVPPRLLIGGRLYSPFDAVSRRLQSAQAAPLTDLMAACQQAVSRPATPFSEPNALAWERLADNPAFTADTLPANRSEAHHALDPWLAAEGVVGRNVLCLAAGGGTHGPLLAMAGANTTVVDLSQRMLDVDRQFAKHSGLAIETIQTSLEDLHTLTERVFDIVVQPVSMSYLAEPALVYRQVARLLHPQGLYLIQHKNPISLQLRSEGPQYWLSAMQAQLLPPEAHTQETPAATDASGIREAGTYEIPHSLETLIGQLCRAGFFVEDFKEPLRSDAWASAVALHIAPCLSPHILKLKLGAEQINGLVAAPLPADLRTSPPTREMQKIQARRASE